MSVKVDLTFVWSNNSSWETSSTISMDTNDSLADISELNGDDESETNSEGDTVHGTTTGLCKVRMRTADADGGRRMADGGRRTDKKKENN